MTPEEKERSERIDRQLEFLANSQAHLTAGLDRLTAHVDRLTADVEGLKEIAVTHTTQIGQLEDLMLRLGRIVEEQGRRTEESLIRLASAQQQTDARLNTLIAVVERYFSNGRH